MGFPLGTWWDTESTCISNCSPGGRSVRVKVVAVRATAIGALQGPGPALPKVRYLTWYSVYREEMGVCHRRLTLLSW